MVFDKPNHPGLLDNLQRKQARPRAGAARAEAGVGFVNGAVGLAYECFALGIEEAVVAVIERERDVAAGVFVGEKFALEAADEAFLRAVIAREGKRDGFPFLDFLRCCNPNARHGLILFNGRARKRLFAMDRSGKLVPR